MFDLQQFVSLWLRNFRIQDSIVSTVNSQSEKYCSMIFFPIYFNSIRRKQQQKKSSQSLAANDAFTFSAAFVKVFNEASEIGWGQSQRDMCALRFDIVASLFGLLPSANHKIYDLFIFSPTTQKIIPSWLFQFLFISQNQFILTSQTVLIFNFYTKISLLTPPDLPIGMPFRWNLLSGSSV